MFEGFANVWSAVTLSRRLGSKPLPIMFAGEKLVLFRGKDGTPGALIDQCPHRGVQLSLGRITPDGCLECPFHAWQFDTQGRNQHVPLNPDAKRERLAATSLPVREIGGLIWVFTAPCVDAPFEPNVPDALVTKGLAKTYLEIEWNAHWTRAMENMLDSPHVPFVHRTTIGRASSRVMTRDSRMDISWEETPFGGRSMSKIDDKDSGATLDFYKPNIMVLNIPIPGKVFRIHSISVPVGPRKVRMIIVGARGFATFPLLNPFFNRTNRLIADQDQAVVESSMPVEVPPASEEISVRTDRVTLQFRKYYYDTLKHSSSGPPAQDAAELPKGHLHVM